MKGVPHDHICKMILGQLKEEGIEIEMAPLKRILCHHAMAGRQYRHFFQKR